MIPYIPCGRMRPRFVVNQHLFDVMYLGRENMEIHVHFIWKPKYASNTGQFSSSLFLQYLKLHYFQ